MIKTVYQTFKWLIVLILFWLSFLFLTIFTYPAGKINDSAEAAIVLGAAVYHSKPSPVFAERLNHAIKLYHADKVNKLIFTGGMADENTAAESEVAREYAINKNVKAIDIFIETESVTTKQNLIYSLPLLEQEKISTVLIISDALHLKRAMLMANDLSMQAKPSATPSSRYQSFKTRIPFALRELYFYNHYLLFSE